MMSFSMIYNGNKETVRFVTMHQRMDTWALCPHHVVISPVGIVLTHEQCISDNSAHRASIYFHALPESKHTLPISPLFKVHNMQSPNSTSVLANMAAPNDDPSPICASCGRDTGLYDHDRDCPEAWLAQDNTDSLGGSEAQSEAAQCSCENCRHKRHLRDVILPRLRSNENPDWTLADYFGITEETNHAETWSRERGMTFHPEPSGPEPAEPDFTQRAPARYEPTLADFEEYDEMYSYNDRGRQIRSVLNDSIAPDSIELTSTSIKPKEDDEDYEIIEEVFWCESCNAFHAAHAHITESDKKEPEKPEVQKDQEHDPETQVVSEAVLDLDVLEWCNECGRYHAPLVDNLPPESTCPVSDR